MIVVSDTTPILSLLKAGRLELLKDLYQTVVIPKAVYSELTSNANYQDEREEIEKCAFLVVEKVYDRDSVSALRNATGLDYGESEALVLYMEKKADLLLIDEQKGRGVAKKMSVEHVGTMGVLMLAFDEGFMSSREVRDTLDIMLTCDIRLSRKLCNKVLAYVGLEEYF